MAEIILDFIQCHHCGEKFAPNEVSEGKHWKVCTNSPAREVIVELQNVLGGCRLVIETAHQDKLVRDTLLGTFRDEILASIDRALEL